MFLLTFLHLQESVWNLAFWYSYFICKADFIWIGISEFDNKTNKNITQKGRKLCYETPRDLSRVISYITLLEKRGNLPMCLYRVARLKTNEHQCLMIEMSVRCALQQPLFSFRKDRAHRRYYFSSGFALSSSKFAILCEI